jgi:hypothetical protein
MRFLAGASWHLSAGSVYLAVVADVTQRLLAYHGGLRDLFSLHVAELTLGTSASVGGQRDEIPVGPSEAHDSAWCH